MTHGDTWLSCTVCNVPTYSVYSELAGTTTEGRGQKERSVPVSQTRVSSPMDMAAVVPLVVFPRFHLARQAYRRHRAIRESSEQVSSQGVVQAGIRDSS